MEKNQIVIFWPNEYYFRLEIFMLNILSCCKNSLQLVCYFHCNPSEIKLRIKIYVKSVLVLNGKRRNDFAFPVYYSNFLQWIRRKWSSNYMIRNPIISWLLGTAYSFWIQSFFYFNTNTPFYSSLFEPITWHSPMGTLAYMQEITQF